MLFNSYVFIFLFLPLVLAGYALVLRWFPARLAATWLVVASFIFYGWNEPWYVALLGSSIGVNYLLGRWIASCQSRGQQAFALLLGIIINLGLLGYFKYTHFFLDSFAPILSESLQLDIVLPIGISFFTFQQIAFLADTFKGERTNYHFVDYALFVSFFPQLIAGPIVHHNEVLPQFQSKNRLTLRVKNLAIGSTIFSIGLFKKVVLADQFSTYASPVFLAADTDQWVTFGQGWLAALSFTLQLYFDFSGYSDMAIGLGRLFGIRLPINFNSPYKSENIVEFWHRWHMTLSRFLRDYLYIPLGGNRHGPARRYINLMFTMVLGGLWHGAGWTFVAWGALHGLYLCLNHGWMHIADRWFRPAVLHSSVYRTVSILLTFLCVVVGWVFFRSESFSGAFVILRSMFGFAGFDMTCPDVNRRLALTWVASGLALIWLAPNTQEWMQYFKPALHFDLRTRVFRGGDQKRSISWKPKLVFAVLMALVAAIAISMIDRPSEFIYYRF